ncbi:hypothetical protein Y1Q_0001011 [Alligator mississippiensis]|uniref:Uncharacterized protein n=1 Tax=Alligator mississippiensis TaxID=8496 RepID=A0A151NE82_ALLMI|nr:hypothetical protein Y1Q_0001011 [Alligator mississippiensis]
MVREKQTCRDEGEFHCRDNNTSCLPLEPCGLRRVQLPKRDCPVLCQRPDKPRNQSPGPWPSNPIRRHLGSTPPSQFCSCRTSSLPLRLTSSGSLPSVLPLGLKLWFLAHQQQLIMLSVNEETNCNGMESRTNGILHIVKIGGHFQTK